MKKTKISLINELDLLENIDIKNEKYNSKLDFNLKSRILLKNEFFSKFLFHSYYNNSNSNRNKNVINCKTQNILKYKKLDFPKKIILEKNPFESGLNKSTKILQNLKKLTKRNKTLSLKIFNNKKNNKISLKKFSYEEYRKKKYVKHKALFGLNDSNDSSNNENKKQSFKNNKNLNTFIFPKKINNRLIKKIIPNYFLSKKENNLNNLLQNKLYKFNTSRAESKKILHPIMFNNNDLYKTINKKNNIIDTIKSENKPLFFISTTNKEKHKKWNKLNICEKKRYQKIMEILLDFKSQINENPNEELEITKYFLIRNGIKEQKYLHVEKLKKIVLYINNANFDIDVTKSLKDFIIGIIEEKNDNIEDNKKLYFINNSL